MKKVVILGAGSFGTAMAVCAARNGHDVVLVARDPKQVETINNEHRNPKRLSDFELAPNIRATTNIREATTGSDLIIHCIPVQRTPDYLSKNKFDIAEGVPIISTSKGIVVETDELMCQVFPRYLSREEGKEDTRSLAFLSGPSFAKEMMQNHPTTATVATTDPVLGELVTQLLGCKTFRVYTTDDVIGLEVGGALKNPLAIGAGCIEGLGFGFNTLAAFVTRGCHEMRVMAKAMGGRPETLAGLSGIGDLMLTAFGSLSRNRTVGSRLGRGEKLDEILASMGEVAEGVPTAAVAVKIADKYGLDVPIFRVIHAVLEGRLQPHDCLDMLMLRPPKPEDYD